MRKKMMMIMIKVNLEFQVPWHSHSAFKKMSYHKALSELLEV